MKLATAGCPRNCSEATTKDLGAVAVEGGKWEIFVGGAAGSPVRKGDLLCTVDWHDDVLQYMGRFMQYYREHAKYLERTYDFVERVGIGEAPQPAGGRRGWTLRGSSIYPRRRPMPTSTPAGSEYPDASRAVHDRGRERCRGGDRGMSVTLTRYRLGPLAAIPWAKVGSTESPSTQSSSSGHGAAEPMRRRRSVLTAAAHCRMACWPVTASPARCTATRSICATAGHVGATVRRSSPIAPRLMPSAS